MLRGALYLTQDFDRRSDFEPMRSVSVAFDTLDGSPRDAPCGEFATDDEIDYTNCTGKER